MKDFKMSCPGCHKQYTVKTQNPDTLGSKEFRCPKCGFSAPFSILLGNQVADNPALHTHIAGGMPQNGGLSPVAGQKTKVVEQMAAQPPMYLVVSSTERSYRLMPGVYILGRASSDSKATLRLAPDPYMSRQHARLTVTAAYGKVQCQLSGLASANPIYVNNKKLEEGSAVTLKYGDKILLGMTEVLFTDGPLVDTDEQDEYRRMNGK